jgi:hypothetical protein
MSTTTDDPKPIITDEYHGDPAQPDGRHHWTSVISHGGTRYAILSGPYATHAEAEAHVDRARFIAEERYPASQTAFARFGTCSTPMDVPITPKLTAEDMDNG